MYNRLWNRWSTTHYTALCQVAAHCPGNSSCCLDSELYRRCVPWDSAGSNTTDTAAAAPDLAAVCAAAPADLADLAGWDCR